MTGAWGDDTLPELAPARDWLFVTCEANGHEWVSDGGRPCPQVDQGSVCPARNLFCSRLGLPSQPVFRCARCQAIDYGEAGGPGALACETCKDDAT